jgi:hypothetical protein
VPLVMVIQEKGNICPGRFLGPMRGVAFVIIINENVFRPVGQMWSCYSIHSFSRRCLALWAVLVGRKGVDKIGLATPMN